MKTTPHSLYLQIAAVVLALTFGARAYAESPRERVAQAYALLNIAEHDYAGHRVKAMKELEIVDKALGFTLESKAPEKMGRPKADQQLADARKLLLEARERLDATDREALATHLEKAIVEIDAGLYLP